jgi:hypothetical protein
LSAQASAQANADASVQARSEAAVMAGLSAETRARLEAMFTGARERRLPTEPMKDRIAEGQAKGATEAGIVTEVGRTMGQLESAHSILVRSGRETPSEQEVTHGASVLARGATAAQLEAVVGRAPEGRPLGVALEVLADLTARGLPVENAVAQVSSRLAAGASDAQLIELKAGAGLGVGRKP